MVISRVLTSRRMTISLALAAPVTLGACELDPPSATVPDAPSPRPAPDAEVLASARRAILQMVASLESVALAQPGRRAVLDPLLALHAAHLEVLHDGTVDDPPEIPGPAGDSPGARERLLAHEAVLATALADSARRAASGDLARALASMSAAVRQRLVT